MGNIQSISYFIPELVVIATLVVAIIADLIYSDKNSYKVGYLVITGLVMASLVLWLSPPEETTPIFLNTIVVDPFSRSIIFSSLILK